MHQHDAGPTTITVLFTVANLAIAAGYVSVPLLVLPYLPLTRTVLLFGAGFFAGCSGSHLWMAFGGHHQPGWFWTAEHTVQAICTWGFILAFRAMLRSAQQRRTGGGGPP